MKAEPPEKNPLTPEPPRPTSPDLEPLKAELRAMVAEQCDRLSGLLEEHEAGQPDDDAESVENAECAAFDDSPEGDRLHRYQAHWSRTLLRTLDAIERLRHRGDDDMATDCELEMPGRCDHAVPEPEDRQDQASAGGRGRWPDGESSF